MKDERRGKLANVLRNVKLLVGEVKFDKYVKRRKDNVEGVDSGKQD